MKRLFIIGNGFDIAHGLSTRYSDFQNYLEENYLEALENYPTVPWSITMPDGDYGFINDNEVVNFLLKIITESEGTGERWSDLENTLGHLDFDECFDWDILNDDDDDDDDLWHKVYNNEDISTNIYRAVLMIKELFSDWISTIDVCGKEPKEKFNNLIEPDHDLFLTFNYTETLEQLYKAKNVYHIHGKQGEELVFGHGNDDDRYDEYSDLYIGAESQLSELHAALRKDTESIIIKNIELFKELANVNEIYSYGFSFSDVDMVYIKTLCNLSNTENAVWYFNDHDKSKLEHFKRKLIDCGFKGSFKTFTI